MVKPPSLHQLGLTAPQLPGLLLTLTLAGLGGALAVWLHLPLGWLLGALLATGIAAAAGFKPFGQPIFLPGSLRTAFVPVIGVSIGAAFTADIARNAIGWWPTALALFIYVPLVHWAGYRLYRFGGLAPKEAYFGAVPGGLLESVQLGEEAGANVQLLTLLQFLRLILTIVTVPLIFLVLTGEVVGSAGGAQIGAGLPLSWSEIAILAGCAIGGAVLGRMLHFPGWVIIGPLACSALAHVFGFVEGAPAHWVIAVTQVVLGAGLGAKFAGVNMALLRRAGFLAVLNGMLALSLAFSFALVLQYSLDEAPVAIFLAYAPGGVAEMSLIALSLQVSAIFVSVHHVVRILIAVLAAQLGRKIVGDRGSA